MRKKLLIGLMSLIMVGLFAGIGQAVPWTDTRLLNPTAGIGTYTYFHLMPSDFSAPPAPTGGHLEIYYGKAFGVGVVTVNGDYVGSEFVFNFSGIDSVGFNVHDALSHWDLGDTSLQVDLIGAAVINFTKSVLTFDYTPIVDGNNNHTAVPEPGTLILLGSSLLGLVVVGRKKFRK